MKILRCMLSLLLFLALGGGLAAMQKGKPWTEWSQKDVEKILNNSGWSHTQSDADLNRPNPYSPSLQSIGILGQQARVNYRIRFISAKPVRQAFCRLLQLDRKGVAPNLLQQAQEFIDREFDQVIVVAVDYDSTESRLIGPAFRAFSNVITSTLAPKTFLQVSGERVFLQEYLPPDPSRIGGAWFIFPRFVDGKPFIDPKARDVQFRAEFPSMGGTDEPITLDWRFKIADFVYDGVHEY